MNKWLIIHSIKSYTQHKELIGCEIIKNLRRNIPKVSVFSKLKPGDSLVYYAKGKKIIGIMV